MAELKLTEKELQDYSYLSWDDDAIGKLVKKTALKLEDYHGKDTSTRLAAVLILIGFLRESGNDQIILEVDDLEREGEKLGDFKVIITKNGEDTEYLENL